MQGLIGPDPEDGPFLEDETGEGYRRMFAALPVPAVLLDTRGFIRLANTQASAFLGLSHHGWLQRRSMLQLMAVQDRQRLQWRLNDRSARDVFEMHGITLAIDAYAVPCDLHLVRLSMPALREPLALAVMVDRSLEAELRASEEQVRQQSQRMADAMWASQSGFWEWDMRSDQIVHDERFAQILGLGNSVANPVSTRSLTDLIHPEDRTAVRALTAPERRMGDAGFNFRMRMRHRAGGWVWLSTRGRVLEWDDDDRPCRVGGAIYDVSQEVEREAELRAAKERAELSERLKTQWLANVGHEVRTPLNSVIGLVQLMQENTQDPHQKEYLARAAESAEHLRLTLDDLLDNAKLEAGRLTIEQLPIELHQLAQGVVAMFGADAQSKGVSLSCTIYPRVPQRVLGDPLRLRQIITNLLSNALKFTLEGSIDLVLEAAEASGNEAVLLQVTVVDTGIGIDPGVQPRLFTPFFQADAATTRQFGGSGLGLSICKRLVELMGGRIGVVSSPGHGSRFWFSVPLRRVALQNESQAATELVTQQSAAAAALSPNWASPVRSLSRPSDETPAPSPPGLHPAAAQRPADWHDFAHFLMLHDPRAVTLGEALLAQVRPELGPAVQRAVRLARHFEFDAALKALESAPSIPTAADNL